MRYRLRTLLIVLAIGPPLLAGAYFFWASRHAPLPPPKGPIIYEAKFSGNRRHARVQFIRVIGLRQGIRLSPKSAEEARQKIVGIYERNGYPQVSVQVVEGGNLGDKSLAFKIVE
jgi:hypothetical protein